VSWPEQWNPPPPQWPPAPNYAIPLPPTAPVAPPPKGRRTRRKGLLAAGALSAVVALATGNMAWSQWAGSNSPGAVVKRYFHAVSAGDAPTALAFADQGPTGAYLTSDVLKQQLKIAKLTDVKVRHTSKTGSTATVEVEYRLAFAGNPQTVTDEIALVKHGSSWRLSRVSTAITFAQVRLGSDRIVLAGRPVQSTTINLLPGAVPVATDTPAVEVLGHPEVHLEAASDIVQLAVDVSGSRKKQAAEAVDAAIAKCLDATSSDPLCPQPDVKRPVPGSLKGKATKKLADGGVTVQLASDGQGLLDVSGDVAIDGSWKTWNFDNQAVPGQGPITVHVKAKAALDDPATIYWLAAE
jgi:hypothetical protein